MTFPIRYVRVTLPLVLLFVLLLLVRAQEGTLDKSEPKGITVDEVIKRFAARRRSFRRRAINIPTARRQGPDDRRRHAGRRRVPPGLRRSFDDKGHKVRTVVVCAANHTGSHRMTTEDFDDIENRLPFVLTSDEIGEYDILYIGQQKRTS